MLCVAGIYPVKCQQSKKASHAFWFVLCFPQPRSFCKHRNWRDKEQVKARPLALPGPGDIRMQRSVYSGRPLPVMGEGGIRIQEQEQWTHWSEMTTHSAERSDWGQWTCSRGRHRLQDYWTHMELFFFLSCIGHRCVDTSVEVRRAQLSPFQH